MSAPVEILIVDPEPADIATAIAPLGARVRSFSTSAAGLAALRESMPALLIYNTGMPLHYSIRCFPALPRLALADHYKAQHAGHGRSATRGYLPRRPLTDEFLTACRRALQQPPPPTAATDFIGLTASRVLVDRYGPLSCTVLISGETGTGKELIARALHVASRRAGPFVPVNCAGLSPTMVDTELFGHERGAFTDAREAHAGLFAAAEPGTLFLDEISDLPPLSQANLLRVLNDREIRPVGATASRRVDVRVVAATNTDLRARVKAGTFRADLFWRLHQFTIALPPLRARREEILPLAEFFLDRTSGRHGLARATLTTAAALLLQRHRWDGNVRELEFVIERAAVLHPGQPIRPADLLF